MDSQQIEHASQCLELFNKTAINKYSNGQKKYGTNMWEQPGMAKEAYMEVVDSMFYLSTIIQQIELASKFLNEGHIDKCKALLNNLIADPKEQP